MLQNRFPSYLAAMVCAVVMAAAPSALAGNSQPALAKTALPGVDSDYSIKPLLPEPDEPENGLSATRFKIGNMDVRIGGTLSVDVGTGSLPRPRR